MDERASWAKDLLRFSNKLKFCRPFDPPIAKFCFAKNIK